MRALAVRIVADNLNFNRALLIYTVYARPGRSCPFSSPRDSSCAPHETPLCLLAPFNPLLYASVVQFNLNLMLIAPRANVS